MKHIKSMTLPEIGVLLKELGQPTFRAKQVYSWLHKGVRGYEEMTNLPKNLRDILAQQYPMCPPTVVRKQESKLDGTIKYLWQLSDGNCVETVLMRYHYGNTVCISTEVGCKWAALSVRLLWGAWFASWNPLRCWIKCCLRRSIPVCRYPILS